MGSARNSYVEFVWLAFLALVVLAGLAAVGYTLWVGHEHAYNVSREVPWGILISTYVFFVVSCSGLCLVSSLGHVFGVKQFESVSKRAILLAIITMLVGFATIAMEIPHPFRMVIWVILSPNLQSPIWWMGALYGGYLVILCIEFFALMNKRHNLAHTLGLIGFLMAMAASSNLGGVFGLLEARPFWYGAFLPVYLILTALVSGGALLALIVYFNQRVRGLGFDAEMRSFMANLGKLQALFIGLLAFFMVWRVIAGLYGRPLEGYDAMMALINGPLSIPFWLGEVVAGLAIPLFLLLRASGRTPGGVALAGGASIVGMFFMRYDMVIAGQLVPMRIDVAEGFNRWVWYVPSIAEITIVVGAIAACLLIYTLAERHLDLSVETH